MAKAFVAYESARPSSLPTLPDSGMRHHTAPVSSYESRVRATLIALGSPDPDGDMLATKRYLENAEEAGLDPAVTAAGIYTTVRHKHGGGTMLRAGEARRRGFVVHLESRDEDDEVTVHVTGKGAAVWAKTRHQSIAGSRWEADGPDFAYTIISNSPNLPEELKAEGYDQLDTRQWSPPETAARESPTGEEWEVTVRRGGDSEAEIARIAGRKPTQMTATQAIFGGFDDDERATVLAKKMTRAGYVTSSGPRREYTLHEEGAEKINVAYRHALEADEAYGDELRKLFGKKAGDIRYTKRGKGDPGSKLRRLHDAKIAADEKLRQAYDRERAAHRAEDSASAQEARRFHRSRYEAPEDKMPARRAAYAEKVQDQLTSSGTLGIEEMTGEELVRRGIQRPDRSKEVLVATLSAWPSNEPVAHFYRYPGWGFGENSGIGMTYWVLPHVLEGGGAKEGPCTRITRDGVADTAACAALAEEIGPIDSDRDLYRLFAPRMREEVQEVFYVACVDVHGKLCGFTEVARGQVSQVSVSPTQVVQAVLAIRPQPTAYAVAHCHPSSRANPSEADKKLTEAIRSAGAIAMPDVVFMDHLVIASGTKSREYYSFSDAKLKRFSD